jgi:hypothetical protein
MTGILFHLAELKEHDPQMYDELERLWQRQVELAMPAFSR